MELSKMQWALIVVTAIMILLVTSPRTTAGPAPLLNTVEARKFLDTVIQEKMTEFSIPNAAVSVVAGGEMILARGYGYADLDRGVPVDPHETLFRMASTSKLFTWTAVMQLVEQGKLDLNVDVNEYLDFEIPARLEYDRGRSEPQPITLKHLMTHTPGFEDYVTGLLFLSEEQMTALDQQVRIHLPARVFPPGEVVAYSNYGAILAAYIVQRVSGVPFAQYVEESIFGPLSMERSTFCQPLPGDLAADAARAYRYVDGEFREGGFEFIDEAGSMSSTASDMARFMLAHLQGGRLEGVRILQEETSKTMQSQLFTHHQRLDGVAYGFIETTVNGQRILAHGGGSLLFNTELYLLPEKEVGVFIAHSGGNHLVHNEVFQAFMDRFFPSDGTQMPSSSPSAVMLERSREFAGEYHQNRRSFTTSDKPLRLLIGQIHVDADEEGHLLVTHLGETNRFVQIEPGVYQSLREGRTQDVYGEFRTIVFGTDPFGKTMLMTDGPMSYSRAAWYETSLFNASLLVVAVLLIIGSVLYWGIRAAVHRIRPRQESEQAEAVPTAVKWASGAALAYGFLTIAFVLETIIASEPDPVYGLPAMVYGGMPAWSSWFNLVVPLAMAIIGGAVVILAVLAWCKGYWRAAGRIHYSLFAVATVVMVWILWYWNVISV